jgi:hypothetical protein
MCVIDWREFWDSEGFLRLSRKVAEAQRTDQKSLKSFFYFEDGGLISGRGFNLVRG